MAMKGASMDSVATKQSTPQIVKFSVMLEALVYPEEVGGFSATVPALRGCHTEGESMEEVSANLREAAELWLEVAHDHGVADLRTLDAQQ
jgi:predicted RNase H-like HicB family nuclease